MNDFAAIATTTALGNGITKIVASDGAADDRFGSSVAISGSNIVVGAFFDKDNYINYGSAYVYSWNGTSYDEIQLAASDIARDDYFGHSVSISGDNVLVGAIGDDDNGSNSGSAYVYPWDGAEYDEYKMIASHGAIGD